MANEEDSANSPDLVAGSFVSFRSKTTGEFVQGTISDSNPEEACFTIREDSSFQTPRFLKDIEDLKVISVPAPNANNPALLKQSAFNLCSESGGLGSIFPTADDTGSCACPMSRSLSDRDHSPLQLVIVTSNENVHYQGYLQDCTHCSLHGPMLGLTRGTHHILIRGSDIKDVQLVPDQVFSNTFQRPPELPIQIGSIMLDINQAHVDNDASSSESLASSPELDPRFFFNTLPGKLIGHFLSLSTTEGLTYEGVISHVSLSLSHLTLKMKKG